MSYSQFTLASVKRKFGLQTRVARDVFANIPFVKISDWLKQTYDYGLDVALASDSEKARSELIIKIHEHCTYETERFVTNGVCSPQSNMWGYLVDSFVGAIGST